MKLAVQKNAWLGDALIRFYVREYLLQTFPEKNLGDLWRHDTRLGSNWLFDEFYKSIDPGVHGAESAATRFEQFVYKTFLGNPHNARKLVYRMCDYYFEKTPF